MDPWKGRRRATWRLRVGAVPIGLALATAMVAAGFVVVRAVVGPVPVRPSAIAADWTWLPLVVVVVVLTAATSDVGEAGADTWLHRRALTTTVVRQFRVRRWLRLTRTLRALGFLAPVVVSGVAGTLVNTSGLPVDDPRRVALMVLAGNGGLLGGVVGPALGYGVGALLAELLRPTVLRRAASTRRAADLRPRDPVAYEQPLARWGRRGLGAGALLTAVLAGGRDAFGVDGVTVAVLAVTTTVVVEVARWWMVSRPQPDPTTVDLDDAFRASSLHGISGAAIGLLGGVWATYLGNLALDWQGPGRTLAGVVSFVVGLGSLGVWAGYGTDLAWTVRRGGRPPASASRPDGAPA